MKTPVRRLERITYWVIDDPEGIHDFINNEIRREWEQDARSEGREPKDDPWLKALSKRKWSLKIADMDRINLDTRITNLVDLETGCAFLDSLAKRSQELKETIEKFASVIWPLIVKKEDFTLVDGYCRYATLKAMNVSKTYAYVGAL